MESWEKRRHEMLDALGDELEALAGRYTSEIVEVR